jgi:DNA-binding transcriptional ArsR family regulator
MDQMDTARSYDLDRIFQALSDSTRRGILRQVMAGEQSVSEIAAPHHLTFAAVSKHLKVLEAAGLVDKRKNGSFQIVRLNPDALEMANAWLSHHRKFWEARLASLKSVLEDKE